MSRFIVIGAGAIGATLAAQFEQAGIANVLVARGENLASIRSRGLIVRRPGFTDVVQLGVVGSASEIELRHDDVLVLATKTQDAEAVLSEWAWLPVTDAAGEPTSLAADLPILTFQNGLSTEDLALRRFRRVYGVSIGIAVSYLSPGEVVSPSYPVVGMVWIGRYGGAGGVSSAGVHDAGAPVDIATPPRGSDAPFDADQERFAGDLRRAGYEVYSVPDIARWKARKLLANVANALDVLDATDDERAEARSQVIAEARAVFEAAGIAVPDAEAVARAGGRGFSLKIEPVEGHTPGRLSTWQSFARGASSEVDYLNGEVVLAARKAGVPAPLNERLQRLLGAQARSGAAPGSVPLSALFVPDVTPGAGDRFAPQR